MNKEKETEILATGLTSKEAAQLKRKGKSPVGCYVCKRKVGEDMMSIRMDDKEVFFRPVEPTKFQRRITCNGKVYIYTFDICPECRILLGFNDDMEEAIIE